MFVYKYLSLDDSVLNSLEKDLVMFTPISNFGDFFEGREHTSYKAVNTDLSLFTYKPSVGCKRYPSCPPRSDSSSCILDLCGAQEYDDIRCSTKVASFSKSPTSLPLYASYGKYPIVLEYELESEDIDTSILFEDYLWQDVVYDLDLVSITHPYFNALVAKGYLWREDDAMNKARAIILDILRHKHSQFIFEKEKRLIKFNSQYKSQIDFVKASHLGLKLVSVILSKRLSDCEWRINTPIGITDVNVIDKLERLRDIVSKRSLLFKRITSDFTDEGILCLKILPITKF